MTRRAAVIGLLLGSLACGPGPLILDSSEDAGQPDPEIEPPSETEPPSAGDDLPPDDSPLDPDVLPLVCDAFLPDDYVAPADPGKLDLDCTDGVAHGTIERYSMTALEELATCRVVVGDLLIGGSQITSLEPLADLECVTGTLSIGSPGPGSPPTFETLTGLEHLVAVLGRFDISNLNRLEDLSSLAQSLRVVGTLALGDLLISDLGALSEVQAVHGVELRLLMNLRSLDGLLAPRAIELDDEPFSLDISSCWELESLRGFGGPRRYEMIQLNDLEQLQTLEGLESATHIADLQIRGVPLRDLGGLDQVQEIGSLELRPSSSGGSFESIGPLPRLERVSDVSMSHVDQLQNIGALAHVRELSRLHVEFSLTPPLEQFDLDYVEQLYLGKMDDLTAERLPRIERAGDVTVVFNGQLNQAAAELWASTIAIDGQVKIGGNAGATMNLDPCPWVQDGECDEQGRLCANGTDLIDCAG